MHLHCICCHHAAAMVDFSAPLTIPAAALHCSNTLRACNSTCSSITHVNDVILHHLYASAVHPPIRHHAAAMVDFSAPLTIPAADGTAATHSDACNSTCSSITHVNDVILHHLYASAVHPPIRHHAAAMVDFSAPLTIPAADGTAATHSDACNSTCSSITHVNDVILHHLHASALHLRIRHHAAAMMDFSAALLKPSSGCTHMQRLPRPEFSLGGPSHM